MSLEAKSIFTRKKGLSVESNRPIKVCYIGTYRENYSRNQMMIAGLRLNGVVVAECHENLWNGIEDRVQVVTVGWKQPKFWWRLCKAYWYLIKRYKQMGDFDILIVGYPGQLDVFLAKFIAWLNHKPFIWDVFMSIYLISMERGLDKASKTSVRLLHFVERLAVKLPDKLILDTNEYVNWFNQNYKVDPDRFFLIPTGADDRIFTPAPTEQTDDRSLTVLYAGTFIPNHGVKYIVEAAELLKGESQIFFELIGEGPDLAYAQLYVEEHQLSNVKFLGWMEKSDLIKHMIKAAICLGAFGTTPQSVMTVQNKIYEALAIGKPLITGDSPAIRQVCSHGENVYLCDRANGLSLAQAILALQREPILRKNIGKNGYKLFNENYSLLKNGKRFESFIREVVK